MNTKKPRMPSLGGALRGMAMPKAKPGRAAKPIKQVKTPAPKMMKPKVAMPMAPSFGGRRRKGVSF